MMDNQFYPDWQSFAFKYRGREQDAFEDLARTLFRKEMGIKFGLFQRVNHKGNETDVIEKDGKVIGFQAKYFEHGIDADNIIHSMKEAKEGNPSQSHYYIYCNKAFGNPVRRKGSKKTGKIPNKTVNEEKIENEAKKLGVTLVWKLDKAILDEAISEKWIYDVFFNVHGKLDNLIKEERRHTEIAFNSINYASLFKGQEIHIERNDIISQIEQQLYSSIMVIHGEGGCGKTAILHEFFDKCGDEVPVCYRKATSLNVRSLSEVFRQGDIYSFSDFKEAYKDCEKKYFIIDSAEHIDEIEDGTIVPSLIKGLMDDGWCIVFTVRNVFITDLLNLLSCELGKPEIKKVDITLLAESVLRQISKTFGIQLPNDPILLDRIRNLFYLDLYIRYYNEIDYQTNDTSFMQIVWDKIIRGKSNRIGYMRENEFESFILDRIKTGSFFLSPKKYVSKEFDTLIEDEIIAVDPINGLFITHDIFEEWGLYRMVDKYWKESDNVKSFFTNLGETRAIRRAFRLWLKDKVMQCPNAILDITQAAFNVDMPGLWKDEVICALLLSEKAAHFFNNYEVQILNNTDGLADKIIWALRVGCQYVNEVVKYKEFFIPSYVPMGSGWEYIIDLIYNHQSEINLSIWLPILRDWTRSNLRGDTTRKVGLMVIAYYQSDAYKYERYRDLNKKLVHEIVSNSVFEIKDELSALLYRCIEIKELNEDLAEFILTDNNRAANIHLAIPQTVIDLCEHYWMAKDNNEEEDHYWNQRRYQDNGFGMDENGVVFKYFPPGANQTPLSSILVANESLAVNYIIGLMNKCVKIYSESRFKDTLQKIIVTDGMDRKNWQWHSLSLWCMYRGTGTPIVPYSLQSIHMALERYLLYLSKEGLHDRCEAIMQRLLFECHSSSVSAVVGSIILAYPNEYWGMALILFRTIEFIQMDSQRHLLESNAKSLYELSNGLNPSVTSERMESCKQKHRNTNLENICLNYQFYGSSVLTKEENDFLIQEIYKILNEHKKLIEKVDGDEKSLLEILISRMDRRQLIVKSQKKTKGGLAIQFETNLSGNALKMSNEALVEHQDMMKYTGLLTWAIAKFKGDVSASIYNENPQTAIKEAQKLHKEIEAGRIGFITDIHTPAWVCACLLKFYTHKLTDEQLIWCKDLVVKKLKQSIVIDALDATAECIHVLPILIELYPKEKGTFKEIMLCSLLASNYGNTSTSSCVITSVKTFGMWEKDPTIMKELVMSYIESISIDTLQPYHLKVVLGLIPNRPNQEMTNLAIQYLKIIPKFISNAVRVQGMFDVLDELAYLLLHTESVEIMNSLDITNAIVKKSNLGQSYLMQLIYETDRCKNSDRFWTIWNSYRKLLAELIQTEKNEILRTYTLNVQWNDGVKDWHSLRRNDLDFFTFLGENCQDNVTIFEGLVKILTTIGSNFKTEGMGWIARAIEQRPTMNLANTTALFYLEMIMMPYIYANKMQIRKNHMLLEQVRTILNFMVSKSSVTGFILRDMLN